MVTQLCKRLRLWMVMLDCEGHRHHSEHSLGVHTGSSQCVHHLIWTLEALSFNLISRAKIFILGFLPISFLSVIDLVLTYFQNFPHILNFFSSRALTLTIITRHGSQEQSDMWANL